MDPEGFLTCYMNLRLLTINTHEAGLRAISLHGPTKVDLEGLEQLREDAYDALAAKDVDKFFVHYELHCAPPRRADSAKKASEFMHA